MIQSSFVEEMDNCLNTIEQLLAVLAPSDITGC